MRLRRRSFNFSIESVKNDSTIFCVESFRNSLAIKLLICSFQPLLRVTILHFISFSTRLCISLPYLSLSTAPDYRLHGTSSAIGRGHHVRIDSAFYLLGIGESSPGSKAAGA